MAKKTKPTKRVRRTYAQKLSDATDQMIKDHNTIDECLCRLELLAMEMGWHAEAFLSNGLPMSSASSAKIAAEIGGFCKRSRKDNGFNNDIPW